MPTFSKEKVLSSAKALVDFINAGPSPYHVVRQCKKRLTTAGFTELSEKDVWDLKQQGKYFVTRNDSTIMAFAVGGKYKQGNGFTMVGAHTDSPCFKVKPISKREKEGFLCVGTQCYGGGIWHTWFDRDLTVAGQVIMKKGDNYISRLVRIKEPILRIPNICIHLNRGMNDNHTVNKETQTVPVIATKEFDEQLNSTSTNAKPDAPETPKPKKEKGIKAKHHSVLLNLLCEKLACSADDIIDFDLCLADMQPATIGGAYKEFIFAPRLDNLFNAYTALQALINSEGSIQDDPNIRMINLYDNEEVGSQSAQGAGSTLTELIMRRICAAFGGSFEQAVANSYLLSVDQAHAIHPNYPEKHEDNHKPKLHGGIVVKINANQRYATTAITSSILRVIAEKCEVPLQDVVVRNDSACGSTIGPIMSAKLGLRTLDMGGPMLSMHSIREQCCTSSVEQSVTLFHSFFEEFPKVDASFKTN